MRVRDSGGGVNHTFPVSNGLLTPEHVRRVGSAVWVFLWYVDHTTKEEAGVGLVHGGKPIADSAPAGALGLDRWTVMRHRRQLERERYIKTKRTRTGYQVWVLSSKKWAWRGSGSRSEKCNPAHQRSAILHQRSAVLPHPESDNHKDSHNKSPLPPFTRGGQGEVETSGKSADIHPEMDLIAFMEKSWRENPHTRKTLWKEPKYPDGVRRREGELGVEAFRALWLKHLEEHPQPGLREFLKAVREMTNGNGGVRPGETVEQRDLRRLREVREGTAT